MLTMTESRWKVYEKELYYSFNAFKKIVSETSEKCQ